MGLMQASSQYPGFYNAPEQLIGKGIFVAGPAHANLAGWSSGGRAWLKPQGVPWLHSLRSPTCRKIHKMPQTLLNTDVNVLLSVTSWGFAAFSAAQQGRVGCGMGIRFSLYTGQSASSGSLMCPFKA